MQQRYITPFLINDLKRKMAWVSGPKGVGKTTLARNLAKAHWQNPIYLNWDNIDERKVIQNHAWAKKIKQHSFCKFIKSIHPHQSISPMVM